MAYYAGAVGRRPQSGRPFARFLVMPLGAAIAALAAAPIAYMVWPKGSPIAPDAPSVPVIVGGVVFNVPPAAIRFKPQRRPGIQPRLDMTFEWPSLDPPDSRIKPLPTEVPNVANRLFATVIAADSTLPPLERLKTIYPRYLSGGSVVGIDGLSTQAFRDGSPYHGEDLVIEPNAPERFMLRCTRPTGSTPPMCLHERRIAGADVTFRFPREWLNDWRSVASAIEKLLTRFRPQPTG